jgi:hypothetical protein
VVSFDYDLQEITDDLVLEVVLEIEMPCAEYLDLIHKGPVNASLPYYPCLSCKFGIFYAYLRHFIYSLV